MPDKFKQLATALGFQRGIFDDTGGWPHQLYVREAHRMKSDYVLTQKDIEGSTDAAVRAADDLHVVGAIRWDAFYGSGGVEKAVESSLGQP